MERYRLHHLHVALAIDCLPAAAAHELRGYFAADCGGASPELTVELEATPTPASPRGRPVFFHGTVHGYLDEDGFCLWDGASLLRIDEQQGALRGRVHASSFDDEHRLVHVFLFIGLVVLLRSRGLYHMHAGAVVTPSGRGILIVGDSGAGKTTLTIALAEAGCRYLGDDAILLHPRAGGVAALQVARPFHVAPKTVRAFPTLKGLEQGSGARSDGKRDLSPATAFPDRDCGSIERPGTLIFPSVDARLACRVEALDDATAFEGLLRSSAMLVVDGMPRRPEHLQALQTLMRGAEAYAMTLGRDMSSSPDRFARLLSRCMEGEP